MRVCLALLSITMPLLSAWSFSVPSLSVAHMYSRSVEAAKQNPAWTTAAVVGTSALVCSGLYAWYKIRTMSLPTIDLLGADIMSFENRVQNAEIPNDQQPVDVELDSKADYEDLTIEEDRQEVSDAMDDSTSDYQSMESSLVKSTTAQDQPIENQTENTEQAYPLFDEGNGSHLNQMGESRDGTQNESVPQADLGGQEPEIKAVDSTVVAESESEVTQDKYEEIPLNNPVNDEKDSSTVNKIKKRWNVLVGSVKAKLSTNSKTEIQNQRVTEQLLAQKEQEQKEKEGAVLADSLRSSQSSYSSAWSQPESEINSQLVKNFKAKKLLEDVEKVIADYEENYKEINFTMMWAAYGQAIVKEKIKYLDELAGNLNDLMSNHSTSIVRLLSSKLSGIQVIKENLTQLVADINVQLEKLQDLTYLDKLHFKKWRPY